MRDRAEGKKRLEENEIIQSDGTWKCLYRKGHRLFRAEGYFDSLAPNEEIYAQESYEQKETAFWNGTEFDFSKETEIPWRCLSEIGFLKPRLLNVPMNILTKYIG